jgi:hypothetical protein
MIQGLVIEWPCESSEVAFRTPEVISHTFVNSSIMGNLYWSQSLLSNKTGIARFKVMIAVTVKCDVVQTDENFDKNENT